jgi:DNA-binding LacI/PurR family transcriptional regulator
MLAAVAAAGQPAKCLMIVETPYTGPEVVANLFRRNWPKHTPDALVLLDWREFVAASAFLHASRVEIPRDVSVAVLSHNPAMAWHIPPISHFELPVRHMARIAAKWLAQGKLPHAGTGRQTVEARWIEGGSVARRR